MRFVNKSILIISPEPWDHIFVSKHHYAVHLARRNNKVFFLGPPSGQLRTLDTNQTNVVEVVYPGFPRGLRFFPKFLISFFIRRTYNQLQHACSTIFDIVWSFDNSVFFDFSALPEGVLKINHIVDLNQDFQTRRAAETADFCFCTTERIRNRLLPFNKKVKKINHGFSDVNASLAGLQLPGTAQLKAVYAGNLSMPFMDWNLILKVASEYPEIDIILIGPDNGSDIYDHVQSTARERTFELANVHRLGKVDAANLIRYEKSADILMVTYQEDHFEDQENPHKMMGYLGSGRMIVATFTAEFVELRNRDLLLMSNRNDEYVTLFGEAVREIHMWNSSKKQTERISVAMKNTYDMQLERIEEFIGGEEPHEPDLGYTE